jgi:predicted TIM-barrel fold metal-dependent hydrolase
VQLPEAAKLCARHPDVPVCIDHLGKPRILNQEELEARGSGVKAMAAIAHVHVKLSMLGYALYLAGCEIQPGWIF